MMKNSFLFVLGTIWSFSILIGRSNSSALNCDGLDDGAVVAGRSRRLNLPRDLYPIIDRVTRNTDDQGDPSPKFNHLILIVPAILGVALVALIVGLVCYQMRRSGKNRCVSNECLIWCGVMKREPSPTRPVAVIDRSAYDPVDVGNGTRQNAPSVAVTRHPDNKDMAVEMLLEPGNRTSEWVKSMEQHLVRAIPSDKSPTPRGDTPTTDVSVLTSDEEGMSPGSLAEGQRNETHSKKTRFPYDNLQSNKTGGSVKETPTTSGRRPHISHLDYIQEDELVNGNKTGGRDNADCSVIGREGSSDDDDVFTRDKNDNLVDSGVGSEDAADKFLVRQKVIRRKRAKATESIKPGGYRKCPSENSPNTEELEDAVTKVQLPPIMAEGHIGHGRKDHSHISRNTKQHEQIVNPVRIPQVKREQSQGNTEDTGHASAKTERVFADNSGPIPEEHSSHSGVSSKPPNSAPLTDKHFPYGHVEHLHVKVDGDAKIELGNTKDMQVGDRQTHFHHHHHHHHFRPPPHEQDQPSRPFERNDKGRQTR